MRWVEPQGGGPRILAADAGDALVAFTTRRGGVSRGPYSSLDLALHVGDEEAAVIANRAAVCGALGVPKGAWTCANQVHGTDVAVIGAAQVGSGAEESSPIVADALVSDVAGVLLAVLVADCVPVVMVDGTTHAVGVAHAGWRGVLDGVVPCTIEAMHDAYGTRPEALRVWVGPHVSRCCYRVDAQRAEAFIQRFGPAALAAPDRLDLEACVMRQLGDLGVGADRVTTTGICTVCSQEDFYSFRGAQGGATGRFAGVAVLGPVRVRDGE